MPSVLSLFPPWTFADWEQVDDSVKGGSSISHLEPCHPGSQGSVNQISSTARFHGILDTKTLGGAGFASHRFAFAPPLNISPYAEIRIRIVPAPLPTPTSPTRFTLALATTPRTLLPSRRIQSRVQSEADFVAPPPIHDGPSQPIEIRIPFDAFEATYRGRRDERWGPLRTNSIHDLSLMCRSGFGGQEGEFDVRVLAIEACAVGGG